MVLREEGRRICPGRNPDTMIFHRVHKAIACCCIVVALVQFVGWSSVLLMTFIEMSQLSETSDVRIVNFKGTSKFD